MMKSFLLGLIVRKEPVWIVSCGDEEGSWWEVNRVPDFYKNKEDKQ